MPQRYPLAPDHFGEDCHSVNVVPDKALRKALEDLWMIDTDQPEQRLAMLPRIQKLAMDFRKSRAVVQAGPKAVAMVTALIDYLPQRRRELLKDAEALRKVGAQEVGVLIRVADWNGEPLDRATAYLSFESAGVPTINQRAAVSAAGVKVDEIRLRPEGLVSLRVESVSETIRGSTRYEFKPGTKLLKFDAVRHHKVVKTRAKSLDEVKAKTGIKGGAGFDFKVVKVNGEVTREVEDRESFEQEVEWQIEVGLPTFMPFEQKK